MKRFIKKNAPTILTCAGGVGVVATSVAAVKATPKALQLLEEAKEAKGEKLTKLEVVKVAGPAYIPSALIGASTIACIFGANVLNKRTQASMASAYALLDTSYKEYKKKVTDLYGDEADSKVKEGIAKDKYEEYKDENDDGKELFYDAYSGRFFRSTMEDVLRAEYDINRDLALQDWATVNNFYDYLNIPNIDGGDTIGWSTPMNYDMYWQTWIDFSNSKALMDDGTEYYIITTFHEPVLDFDEYY